MEKLLRFLNPKTVNLDAIPSGGIPLFTTADACLMLSYARLTPVQNKLLQCYALNQNHAEQLKSAAKFLHLAFVEAKRADDHPDHALAMFVALVELCAVPADYKPSERNRAVLGGVSRMQIQRKLGVLITRFKDEFKDELDIVESKLDHQMNKKY